MSVVFSCDSLTLVHPENNTADLNYFGMSTNYDPPEQVMQTWSYIGQHGAQIKKLGTGGQGGTVVGFLDASSEPNLMTGVALLQQACKDATPQTINIGTGISIGSGMLVKVSFTREWAHSSRFCMDFVISWVAP